MVPSLSMSDSSRIWERENISQSRSPSLGSRPPPPPGPDAHVVDELLHLGSAEPCVLALSCEAVHEPAQVFSIQGSVVIEI